MKISLDYIDSTFDFEGDWGVQSKCGLKIIEGKGKTIVIAAEIPDNPGTQITSIPAELLGQICRVNSIATNSVIYIEHTPNMNSKLSFYNETFFRVEFDREGDVFSAPKWEELTRKQTDELIASEK